MTGGQKRVEDWAPWVAGVLLAAPVLLAYYPPMTDLAFHEGVIGLLRHANDPEMVPQGLYRMNLGEPNQLFHMTGWALSYVISTRWAVKLMVAAAVGALPVSAARFARHVGASPLAALVVAPMALGWLFSWGLITNLIGLSALLATLPVFDRLAAEPSARRAAAAFGATVLLYFAHMAMMFVSSGVSLGLCVLQPWSWRKLPLRLSPLALGLVITVAQLRWQKHFMTPTVYALPTLWRPLKVKLREIAYIVLPATDAVVQFSMLGLCVLTIAFLFWLRTRERRQAGHPAPPAPGRLDRVRSWGLQYRWEVVAATGFLAFLTFPVALNGATLVHQRWFPPAFAILAMVAAPRNLWTRQARTARIAAFVLPVATLLVAGPSFVDSNREYKALQPLIDRIAKGSAVAEVDLGPGDPSRTYSLGPADGRVLAERGGRLVYAFTDSSVSPMVLRRKYQWNESLIRVGFDSWRFSPAHDLKRYRYVMIRTQNPGIKWMASFALAQEATLVAEEGEWALFESKLDLLPLLSPDEMLPEPKPETMRDRVHQIQEALRDRPDAPQVEVPPEKSGEAESGTPPLH